VQAELQYQKGLVYLRKRDFSAAVASFRWAVKLCPGEGEYAAHLGWALHREALAGGKPSPAEAKKLLADAMRLSPKTDRPYLFLANILKGEGDMAGAEVNFVKAVDRNAQCTEALQELRLIRARRAKQGERGTKRFFR
jgi:cytochrome c-type biogenesis protein CcmH/NrfG